MLPKESKSVLSCSDSYSFVRMIPNDSIKLIITSPPYNLGKRYEKKSKFELYLVEQKKIVHELIRVLHPNGSICWEVGNYVEKGEVFPLDIHFYNLFKEENLKLRNRIIWYFGHGLHASKRFSGRYETILWFTKEDDYTFNLDSVRVPTKYPGKRYYKGSKKGKPSCNPLGKNPSDIWEVVNRDWENDLWNIPNVKSNHPEKTVHPCQFPIELAERCVLALTDKQDWILDPYCGAGSSLLAGLKHDRKVIGCDKENDYIEITKERMEKLCTGTLRIRPLGKPVHKPTGREKVTKIPDEWKNNITCEYGT
jgi:adenine-specific DNA-methyltransferase